MSPVPAWLLILGAIPLAVAGALILIKGVRRAAHFIVQMESAAKLILYELVPNENNSIKDKVDRAVQLGEENQRALEIHLTEHHPRPTPPVGPPAGF